MSIDEMSSYNSPLQSDREDDEDVSMGSASTPPDPAPMWKTWMPTLDKESQEGHHQIW